MPTYVQGTVIPEISDLMYLRRESGRIGMLFRFQGSFEAGSSGWVSRVGMALDEVKKIVNIHLNGEKIYNNPPTCHA
jgi:hypothetical protein